MKNTIFIQIMFKCIQSWGMDLKLTSFLLENIYFTVVVYKNQVLSFKKFGFGGRKFVGFPGFLGP